MSLLAPLYLFLGAAALVPLLIHLLRRRIGTRVDFPAARYLARAEQEHSRSLRLRNLLLMFLRIAIVLFVAAAAARPVMRLGGSGHGPTALAIVFDNSLSTTVVVDGHPLLEQFRAAARDILDAANPSDRLWLITADGRVRGGAKTTLREELDRVEPLGGAGNLALALARAGASVRSAGLDSRQIILFTDGQRSAWTQTTDVGDVQVVLSLPSGTAPVNRAVTSADARPERWTPRGAVVSRLMSKDSTTYRMTLGGRSLARGTAGPNEEVVLRAAPPERGWVDGTIELEPDELPGDNVRHFAVWIGPAPAVAVSPGAGPFVRSAIDVLKGSGRITDGRDIAVVAADELTSLPALIIAPSDPVRIGAANRALERAAVPWRFGVSHRGEANVALVRAPAAPVGASDSASNGAFVDVSASLRYDLSAQSGADADTIARIGRDPWIVAGPRYAIVASPLDPAATTLPVRAAFVPWLATLLTERLVGEPGGVIAATPGQALPRPRWADAIEDQTGARTALGNDLQAPPHPGTFFLERAGRRVGALVVNPESSESLLERLPVTDLSRRIRARQVLVAANRTELGSLSFRSAARRPIAEPILILAMALLVFEALLVRSRRRPALAAA
ncbi:MAG: BatA domain-containing protein [Gemmatimonadaceae bacterium]